MKDGINTLDVLEINFRFCRMDININGFRIQIKINELRREWIFRDEFTECIFNRMMQVRIFNEPFIGKKILFPAFLSGEFRFSYKSGDIDNGAGLLHRYQFLVIGVS